MTRQVAASTSSRRASASTTFGIRMLQERSCPLRRQYLARGALLNYFGRPSNIPANRGTRPRRPGMTLPTASPLVVCLGAHILDILGRPVTAIPPGQGSVLLEEIRLTAAGTAAGTAVDLAKLGARVVSMGAIGDDDLARLLCRCSTGMAWTPATWPACRAC